jgi:hypothetical protein
MGTKEAKNYVDKTVFKSNSSDLRNINGVDSRSYFSWTVERESYQNFIGEFFKSHVLLLFPRLPFIWMCRYVYYCITLLQSTMAAVCRVSWWRASDGFRKKYTKLRAIQYGITHFSCQMTFAFHPFHVRSSSPSYWAASVGTNARVIHKTAPYKQGGRVG